ncbi:hypothetical protein GCM10023231_01080 [Olivibacter ginsenosidimutans]|uniref:Tail fiber domain-containing protein n=2 Tax=Olivibacter ginsenosidimutans TaxID=1176537 RepID=A0ABP9ADP2_9SPHI
METLHVKGNVRLERSDAGTNHFLIHATSGGNYITSDDGGTNQKNFYIRVAPTDSNATDRHLVFQTGKVNGAFQSRMIVLGNGNVGIGTTNPSAKLAVNGNILAKEIKVKTDITVPDYVFEKDYQLPSLTEVEAYVKEHKHLPEIPSAREIGEEGLDVAKMNLLLLKKVEELTLQLIEKSNKLTDMECRLRKLESAQ